MGTKFFHFNQNNTGGSFVTNERVAHNVIIEANSAAHANELALKIGIYFDGCEDDTDCSCCGDRWYRVDDDGDDIPMIYDERPEQWREILGHVGEPYCHIYYLDGQKRTYIHRNKENER